MAVGDNTTDSIIWNPGEATGHKPGGQAVSPPAENSGGGSISATDGTTTVDPATSLSLPSGSVSDGGGGIVQIALPSTASISLNNAQIKALGQGTQVDIVAAPGAGRAIMPLSGYIVCDAVAGEYTFGVGSDIALAWGGMSYASLRISDTHTTLDPLLGGTGVVSIAILSPHPTLVAGNEVGANVLELSECEDLPLGINGANTTGPLDPFGGGHADNSMTVIVTYTIIDIA